MAKKTCSLAVAGIFAVAFLPTVALSENEIADFDGDMTGEIVVCEEATDVAEPDLGNGDEIEFTIDVVIEDAPDSGAGGGEGGGAGGGDEAPISDFDGSPIDDDGVIPTDDGDQILEAGVTSVQKAASSSEKSDPWMGINPSDKIAVAAQCETLTAERKTYEAFFKLYCN